MKKTFRYFSMAALAMMGTILMGCAENDLTTETTQPNDHRSNTVTLTIGFAESAQTRALSASGVKTFKAGDQVALIFKNINKEYVKVESDPIDAADISDDGKRAKINVDLGDRPNINADARLIYPASMAKITIAKGAETYDDDSTIDFSKLAAQDGTLESLGDKLDVCTYDRALNIMELDKDKGAKMPLLTNRLAIGAFTIKDDNGTDITSDVKHLTISDGTNSYIIDRTPAAGPIYVAMRPVANKDFELTALTSTTPYIKNVSGQTLTAGSLYPINVKMEIDKGLCTPLTIEALTDGSITVTNGHMNMKYSVNGGEKQLVSTFSNHFLNVNKGDKVAFYGPDPYWGDTKIGGTGSMKVYGNIMSLVNETDFASITTLTENLAFHNLFGIDSNSQNVNMMLTDASGLRLPATTLTERCYQGMFYKCVNLTAAPEKLPATKLANFCYQSMFEGCYKLTTAPKLPATELKDYCYSRMFYDCRQLNSVTCLATDISAQYCIYDWLKDAGTNTPNPTLHVTSSMSRADWRTSWTVVGDQ